jgi:hypothetical protein
MVAKGRTLVYEVIADLRLVVSCQPKGLPTDAEWNRWLTAVEGLQSQYKQIRLLVASDGGHPTHAQSERLRARNNTNPLTAIVSSSRSLRFLNSALTFINPRIRCFSPSELANALEHLGVAYADQERVRMAIEELQRQLLD